jgi:hypothetical protein
MMRVRLSLAGRWTLVLCLFACTAPPPPPPPPGTPVHKTEVRRVFYPGSGELKKRYVVRWDEHGQAEKHGPEEEWHPDGTQKAEREFAYGLPKGVWRTWFPDGARESLVEIGDGVQPSPMRWWYPDGAPHAEGYGLAGVREGPWVIYHANGEVSERGSFSRGERHGPWVSLDERGEKRAEGEYEHGRRVGPWLLWDKQGVLHVKQGDPPSAASEPEPEGSGDPAFLPPIVLDA